jgi:hypothetical protein
MIERILNSVLSTSQSRLERKLKQAFSTDDIWIDRKIATLTGISRNYRNLKRSDKSSFITALIKYDVNSLVDLCGGETKVMMTQNWLSELPGITGNTVSASKQLEYVLGGVSEIKIPKYPNQH